MCVAGLLDAMRSKLPASARIVWMCLENHADHNRKWSMSLEQIVAEVNLSIETVVRAVRLLAAQGIARGERDGPGRKATTWHLLKSYDPSPHNGGIKTEETPHNEGIEGEQSPQSAGIKAKKSPHNGGIKHPKSPQSDPGKMRGSPQNAGLNCFPPLDSPFLNPPKKKAPPVAPRAGGRRAAPPKNAFYALDKAGRLEQRTFDARPEEVVELEPDDVVDFQAFHRRLKEAARG